MLTRLKISRSATGIFTQRFNGIKMTLTPNIILRNALMYSINNGDKYDDQKIDTGGTEFQISTLFGEKSKLFFLLLNEYYKKRLKDADLKNIISFHIEKGLKSKEFIEIF